MNRIKKTVFHKISRVTALLLCLGLTSFCPAAVLPASAQDPPMSDISGTPFYSAVTQLAGAEIINGYPDGSFRPYNHLSRGEAAALIYRAYGDPDLALCSSWYFHDIPSLLWSSPYIDYCSAAGIVNGYPDGSFRPEAQVTYNEIITMIVRARGLDSASFSWPDSYIGAARSDGMLDSLDAVSLPSDGDRAANRGNTAVLIASGSQYNEHSAGMPAEDHLADPDMNGICFGLITSAGNSYDRLGYSCGKARFLMGGTCYDVLTKRSSSGLFQGYNPAHGLMRLLIENGRAVTAERITAAWGGSSSAGLLTPAASNSEMTEFCRVTGVAGSSVSYQAAPSQNGSIEMDSRAVYYEIGLKNGKLSASRITLPDVIEGDMTAIYSVAGKGQADVLITVHPAYASDVLHASENINVMYMG